jgi:hypothetical protein
MRTLLPLLPFACLLAAIPHRTGFAEPPLRLTLHIDGAEHELIDGKEATFAVGGKELKVKAVVHPCRRFDAQGLAFDFPRDMAFEHEPEDEFESWTLDGNSCVLLIHAHQAGEAEAMAAVTTQTTLTTIDKKAKINKVEVTLGGRKYQGVRGRATTLGTTLEYTGVGIMVGERPFVLMLQESLGDDGKGTAEGRTVLDLLARTLTIGKAK